VNPLVTVIVAVKDGERFLEQALASIRAQDYTPYDILVVDGHSRDRGVAIARTVPGARVVAQEGRGIADAYNTGIAEAAGAFLAFLSHDDLWLPGKLTAQVGYLRAHPEVAYVTARAEFFLEPGHALPPGFRAELLEGSRVAHIMETLVARQDVFDRVGPFDTGLAIAHDVDWFSRADHLGIPRGVVGEVLLRKRVHDTNASMDVAANHRDLLEVARRSLGRRRRQDPGE
jgi:glycosyltransferase involved in cell wall biosynthesis